MPWEDSDVEYRNQVDLALWLVTQLEQGWTSLPTEAQAEIGSLLAECRTQLVQAAGDLVTTNAESAKFQGDRKRAVALNRFLSACETSPAIPNDLKAGLGSAHLPSRRGVSTVSKAHAREIVAAIARLTPSQPAASGQGDTSALSMETFPYPLLRARRFTQRLITYREALSIDVEDAATQALVQLGIGLERAQNEAEREAAAQAFLRKIKAFAPTFETLGADRSLPKDEAQKTLSMLQQDPEVGPRLQKEAEPPPDQMPASLSIPDYAAEDVKPVDTVVPLHTSVDFPAEVSPFDSRIPLVVQFTIERRAESRVQDVLTMRFKPEEVKRVLVVCNAEGFREETGVTSRLIEVYAHRDSQPAVFLLTPETDVEAGPKRISLDFYYEGALALSSAFEVELKDRPPVQRDRSVAIKPLIEGTRQGETIQVMGVLVLEKPVVDPPDLVLRIAMSADERELRFTLDSPNNRFGYRQTAVGSVRLPERKSPREFLETVYESLNVMAGTSIRQRTEAETEANKKAIDKIGWNLYDQLFPQALKDEWRLIRKLCGGENTFSLLIISDEPWVPWEMVHSHTTAENGTFVAEGFLCEQFRLSRWVAGRRLPDAMALNAALLIAPKSNLDSVKRERAYFVELEKTQAIPLLSDKPLEQAVEVEKALEEQKARLYHFACHGAFDADNPDDSGLVLIGPRLRPSDIVGPTQVGIERSKPIFFLNACTSAGADISLTGIGGWAKRLVDAGATAFIGSLWEVNDTLAAEFAKAFYDQVIVNKKALGEAFQLARQAIKQQDPANPTWLAYVLYSHPNGKVSLHPPLSTLHPP